MSTFKVLVCGANSLILHQVAQSLQEAGLDVQTSTRITDRLCQPDLNWDVLLVDLDSLTSCLRGLLPAVRRSFPNLSMVGWVNEVDAKIESLAMDIGLDGYLPKSIEPAQFPRLFPYLARHFVPDTTSVPERAMPLFV